MLSWSIKQDRTILPPCNERDHLVGLRYLTIDECFGEESIEPVGGCERLEVFVRRGGRAIVNVAPLAQLQNLTFLNMPSLTFEQLAEIRDGLPNCTIAYDAGVWYGWQGRHRPYV
jgi:hypothetical protein